MSVGKGKVGDKVDRELFERKVRGGLNGQERRDHRVCANFVLLANGASSNKVVNEHREAWPPEVAFYVQQLWCGIVQGDPRGEMNGWSEAKRTEWEVEHTFVPYSINVCC